MRSSIKSSLFFFILFALFCVLSLWDTRHPVSQVDESIFIHNINCVLTHNLQNAAGPVIRLFDAVPILLFSPYHVCIDQYLYLPLASVIDAHAAIRLTAVLISLLTLWVCFLFADSFIGRTAAFGTVALLAFHAAFIMGTRFSVLTGSPMLLIELLTLLFLWKWYSRKGGDTYLWAAIFLLGLGCTVRIIFFSFVFALAALALLYRDRIFSRLDNSKESLAKHGKICLLLFLAGAFPLAYYNLTGNAGTLQTLAGKIAAHPSVQGDASYPAYVLHSLRALVLFLKGNYVTLFPAERTVFSILSNAFYPPVFVFSFLWFLYAIFVRKTVLARRMLFILALFLLLFAQFFIPGFSFYPHHYYILLPFVCLIIAVALTRGMLRSRPLLVTLGAAAVFLALIGTDVILVANKYYCARRYGYAGRESNAANALADWLKDSRCTPVILDGDTANMLLAGRNGAAKPGELIFEEYLDYPAFKERFGDEFNDPRSVFVFYCDDKAFYRLDKTSLFYSHALRLAGEKGKTLKEIKYFWQPDGKLVYFAARLDNKKPAKVIR